MERGGDFGKPETKLCAEGATIIHVSQGNVAHYS